MSKAKTKTKDVQPLAKPELRVKVRICTDTLGAGKMRLLALLAETGSISAAAKEMGIGYRRAWFLLESLQACFADPLFETARGGAGKGGTHLTEAGTDLLRRYQEFSGALGTAAAPFLDWLAEEQGGQTP